jgi:hypothetical protein
MKIIKSFILMLSLVAFQSVHSQKYMTQNGTISFFSETPVENIEAVNNQVSSVIDMASGNMAFSLLMKAFTFEKALMQEHFNEKYVETEKYPKSTFKGQIESFPTLSFNNGPVEVKVKGTLTLHGESKEITTDGTIELKGDKLVVVSSFEVKVADFKIKIPSTVEDNIAKTIEVKVNAEYEKVE